MGLKRLSAILGLLSWAVFYPGVAQAHYLWLETSEPEARDSEVEVKVFYGEFEESLRETSAGRLGEVQSLEAWFERGNLLKGKISLEKEPGDFKGRVKIPAGQEFLLQAQELDRPVQDWRKYDIGVVKPQFYASAVVSGRRHLQKGEGYPVPEEKTTLGLYPVRLDKEAELRVFFQGKPAPGAKVSVHAPNGWSKEIKADDAGAVRFPLPWAGQYVFEAVRLEKKPGEFQGVPYEAIRHRATFAWEKR